MKLSEKATAVLEETRQKLLTGDLGPLIDFARLQVQGYHTIMSEWSHLNQLLAYLSTQSSDCRGANQWRQAGRWIKPGSRAAFILVPLCKVEKDEDGTEESKLYGFKSCPVFPDHATDGEPLPEREQVLVEELPDLYEVCRKCGIRVEYDDIPGAWGCVDHAATVITLRTKHQTVFYHELAHAIRLRRGWYDKNDYAGEEAIAETVASTFSQLFDGEDVTERSHQYITYYLGSIDKMVTFLGEIARTITELLEVGGLSEKEVA